VAGCAQASAIPMMSRITAFGVRRIAGLHGIPQDGVEPGQSVLGRPIWRVLFRKATRLPRNQGHTGPHCPGTNCMRFFLARVHTGGQTQAACRTIRISPDVHASFRASPCEHMDKDATHVSSFGSSSRGVTRSDLWSMLRRWDLSADLRQGQCRQTSNATGRGDGVRVGKISTVDAIRAGVMKSA